MGPTLFSSIVQDGDDERCVCINRWCAQQALAFEAATADTHALEKQYSIGYGGREGVFPSQYALSLSLFVFPHVPEPLSILLPS